MADLLFPTLHQRLKSQPKALYAAVLTDVARAAFDGVEALTSFRALLLDSSNGTSSSGLMAFDAHVGDTGCHLRAGMFLEVYRLHRNGSPPAWIDQTIDRLRKTQEKAQQICAALTQQSARPQSVGLSGKDLPVPKLLRAVDWEEISLANSSGAPCLLKDMGGRRRSFEGDSSNKSVSLSSTSSTRSRSTSPSSMASEIPLPFETRWTPDNIQMLVRLVVYSFVLSKYKSFSSVHNTVVARLCPEDTAEAGYALMEGFWDFNHSDYRKARVERFSQELRALQVWISDLSSAWLHSVAMRFSPGGMDRLLARTTLKSGKGLTVTPCFVGYLLLRHEWAQGHSPLVMVDRYFCSHGWHFNVYIAHLKSEDHSMSEEGFQRPVEWHIQPVTMAELLSSSWRSQPHAVAMGNSICGDIDNYRARLGYADKETPHVTDDSCCLENAQHIRDFTHADHDRLALSFFGAHKSYPFQLDGQDETEFVGSHMDDGFSRMRDAWLGAASELGQRGGGHESLRIFGWQHVFVESPENVARRVQEWHRDGNLMPLSA